MKNKYTQADMIARFKMLDVRAKKLTDDQIMVLMDRAYGNLSAMFGYAFSDEEVVNMDQYYANGELKLSLDVEEDVIDIYDLYLTEENQSAYLHGIKETRDENQVYRDNRYSGRLHIDLTHSVTIPSSGIDDGEGRYDNCVVKYFYTPVTTVDDIYMDSITYTALEQAWQVVLSDYVKDEKGKAEALTDMMRLGSKITMPPEDFSYTYRNIQY